MVCKGFINQENHQNSEIITSPLSFDPHFESRPWDYYEFANTDDEGLMNLSHPVPMPGLEEFEQLAYYSPMVNINSQLDWYEHLEDISEDIQLWDFEQKSTCPIDENPNSFINKQSFVPSDSDAVSPQSTDGVITKRKYNSSSQMPTHSLNSTGTRTNGKRKSSSSSSSSSELRLEDIQKCFNLSIVEAAKELNIGLTLLKKRCRELNIMRWPHRKIKSLESLIHNVKELGMCSNEVEMLEEHKRMVEKMPQMELTERTKKLRQACFKANHKKKKSISSSNGCLHHLSLNCE